MHESSNACRDSGVTSPRRPQDRSRRLRPVARRDFGGTVVSTPTPRAWLLAGRRVASSFSVGAGSASLKRGTRSRTHRPNSAATIGPSRRSTPGIRVGEYMPLLARQTHRLAIVRSVHHPEAGHRNAAYWNLTGHAPHRPGNDETIAPSRRDWPCPVPRSHAFATPPPGCPPTSRFLIPSSPTAVCSTVRRPVFWAATSTRC